ncbi:MAG TPA: ring-opening amidohydrolase, partial [Blastococcus sp.]
MPAPIEVRKVPLHNVSDASELAKLIDDGVMEADRVIAVIGKTEGNGGVNDYTRIIADRAFREVLLEKGSRSKEDVAEIPIVWSGGTDGVISPHATIFATLPEDSVEKTDEPRLTVGFAMSDQLLPEDIGRTAMVTKVADAVRVAMERAGITDPGDVHYVQTKTPLLTIQTIRDAKSRGKTEGNGGVNDYTRIIADRAFREVLLEKGSRSKEDVGQIPIVWSGGTDGVISPHATIFATLPEDAVEKTDEPRLTVGYAMSDVPLP